MARLHVDSPYHWTQEAACAGLWHVFWPPEEGETAEEREGREAKAKHICRGCPVLIVCSLAERDEGRGWDDAVVAGHTPLERRQRRKMLPPPIPLDPRPELKLVPGVLADAELRAFHRAEDRTLSDYRAVL